MKRWKKKKERARGRKEIQEEKGRCTSCQSVPINKPPNYNNPIQLKRKFIVAQKTLQLCTLFLQPRV